MISSCLGLLGDNYHTYQVIKFFKSIPVKEDVRSLRALSGPAQPPPSPAQELHLSWAWGCQTFPQQQEWKLQLFPWPGVLLLLGGFLGWSLALLHALVCWEQPMDPAGTGTTEEEWDCVRSCSAPQPQQCRNIQILWYFLESTACLVLKCWSTVSHIRFVFQAF